MMRYEQHELIAQAHADYRAALSKHFFDILRRTNIINKAYRCRIYPTKEQTAQIEKTFGACRWVFNLCLETKKAAWEFEKKNLSYYELTKQLTIWKKTVAPWLYEVSNPALQQSIRDLDAAYQNFFRRVKNGEKPGYPKFKSKRSGNQSYRVPSDRGRLHIVNEHQIRIPKLGTVKCRGLPKVEGRILNATIRRVPSGKYYVSLCCADVPEPDMPLGENDILGIDVGIKDLMTRSDGVKVPNNKYLKRSEKKLRREQRKLSRRKKGSNNWKKQKRKVALVHERISNQRKDAMHKATTQAVRESKAIAVEDLNVQGMQKNHHLAKAVSDASMSEIHRQLQYKCDWYGRDFVKVDRWFPSSKTCGNCGCVFDDLTLSMREWTCPECGAHHDRDLNAARNIAKEGMRLLES